MGEIRNAGSSDNPLNRASSRDQDHLPPGRRKHYRRLGGILLITVLTASFLELGGRILFMLFGVPYGVTGSLTLMALLVWGAGTVYVIGHLRALRSVSRLLMAGASLLALSQGISLIVHFHVPVVAQMLVRIDYLEGFLEEGSFVIGLALLLSGLYLSIFEADRANARTEQKHQALLAEADYRRRAQSALGESEEKYRTLVESFPHAVIIVQEGRVVFANPAAAATLGLPNASALIGCDPYEYIAPCEHDRLREYMKARFEGSEDVPSSYEVTLRRENGEEFPSMQYIRMINYEGQLAEQIVGVDLTAMRRAEEALFTKSLAIDMSVTALAFGDTQGRLMDVNPAFLTLWGYSEPSEVLGRPATEFWQDERAAQTALERVLLHGTWTGDLIARTKDGSFRDIHLSASVIKSPDGKLRGIMASFTDLTQYRRVEVELRESRAELQAIYDSLVDGLAIAEIDTGSFLRANDVFCSMFGYSESALLSMTIGDLHPRDQFSFVMAHFRALAGGAQRMAADIPCLRSDGTVFYADITALPLNYRDRFCLMGIFRDCTARKQHAEELERFNAELEDRVKVRTAEIERANAALRESEAKYRELVQSANSIILRMDCEGRITFLNEFAQRFFGYEEQEVLGKNVVGTIVPKTDTNGRDMEDMIRDITVHPDRYANHENENMRRNGERVWITWTNKPIYGEHGEVRETLCVGNDITPRVRAERLLAEQQMRMLNSARLSALGTMASGIAHEINNPLAVMAAGAEQLDVLIEDPVKYKDKIHTVTQMVQRHATRIQRIIRGLRSLSRDASGDPFAEASVHDIIIDTVELCQERFKLHGVDLRLPQPLPEVVIECRAAQIGQVLLNLLNNAFDVVEKLPEKWVHLEVQDNVSHVNLAITDSGQGLSWEIHEKMFIPFYTTKSDQKGLGLGLSISKGIIEAHGGEIAVDSDSPHTRFVIRLPKKQA
ncbi:MAG TPA: PAS domain S-box protein [Candidatus Hydrogenedentes bacterium]|nr:PAS domain S-box protein [Candidatus Hydrogenedentota bacterium]